MSKIEQRSAAKLMRDLEISAATAEFIYNNKAIPDNSKQFPRDTPVDDLISIKIRAKGMEPEDAYISVYVELGVQQHVNTAEVIYI